MSDEMNEMNYPHVFAQCFDSLKIGRKVGRNSYEHLLENSE